MRCLNEVPRTANGCACSTSEAYQSQIKMSKCDQLSVIVKLEWSFPPYLERASSIPSREISHQVPRCTRHGARPRRRQSLRLACLWISGIYEQTTGFLSYSSEQTTGLVAYKSYSCAGPLSPKIVLFKKKPRRSSYSPVIGTGTQVLQQYQVTIRMDSL